MKKISNYIPSVILCVLLIISLLGTSALIVADVRLTSEETIELAQKEDIDEKSYAAIEKYYKEKASATGIPSDVFIGSITKEYVSDVIDSQIEAIYRVFESGRAYSHASIPNPELEASIEDFFNDYADKTNYTKDEKFEAKLKETKTQAYKTINSNCDIFKVDSMQSHGLLSKISKFYRRKTTLTVIAAVFDALMIGLILLVNKRKRDVLYWVGISAAISGIIGLIPAMHLVRTHYYDSFSIKQPQVFAAYTKTLYSLTDTFIRVQALILMSGAVLIVLYALCCRFFKGKTAENQK